MKLIKGQDLAFWPIISCKTIAAASVDSRSYQWTWIDGRDCQAGAANIDVLGSLPSNQSPGEIGSGSIEPNHVNASTGERGYRKPGTMLLNHSCQLDSYGQVRNTNGAMQSLSDAHICLQREWQYLIRVQKAGDCHSDVYTEYFV